jgi:hypothetical protein
MTLQEHFIGYQKQIFELRTQIFISAATRPRQPCATFPNPPVFPALRLTESRAVFPADQDSTRSIRFTKRWARSRTTGFRRAGLNALLA